MKRSSNSDEEKTMKFSGIYIINSAFWGEDSKTLMNAIHDELLLLSGKDNDVYDVIVGFFPELRSNPRLEFHAKRLEHHKDMEDILPYYISGDMKNKVDLIGYIFLLRRRWLASSAAPDNLEIQYTKRVKEDLAVFQEVVPDASYVFALGYQGDKPQNEEEVQETCQSVRDELNLDPSTKIIPCDLQSKDDVKHVVLELMDVIGDFPHREKFMPLIEAL